MSKYLNKDGLEYYHEKIERQLDSSVTINVTQSAHQTIKYSVGNLADAYIIDGSNLPPTGATFRIAIPVYLDITSDTGYNHGTWVVSGDKAFEPPQEDDYWQDQFATAVFLGGTLTVSATPATVATN